MEIYLVIGVIYTMISYKKGLGIQQAAYLTLLWPLDIFKNMQIGWDRAKARDQRSKIGNTPDQALKDCLMIVALKSITFSQKTLDQWDILTGELYRLYQIVHDNPSDIYITVNAYEQAVETLEFLAKSDNTEMKTISKFARTSLDEFFYTQAKPAIDQLRSMESFNHQKLNEAEIEIDVYEVDMDRQEQDVKHFTSTYKLRQQASV